MSKLKQGCKRLIAKNGNNWIKKESLLLAANFAIANISNQLFN